MDGQGVVEQVPVLDDHLQGIAQGALVAEQQADFAKIRELAQLGHAQAEGFAATDPRRLFQQGHHAGHRNALVRIVEQGGAEADLGQQGVGVEPKVARHLKVVGQACSTYEGGHCCCFPRVVIGRPASVAGHSL
ncbi:hypothetical protein D3C76_961640 [compost metagenome]